MDAENQKARLVEQKAIEVLKDIYDPELPVNIYDLGLVYEIKAAKNGEIAVLMTLTAPNCPAAESLPAEVEKKLEEIAEVNRAKALVTFDPPWDKSMMSESAQLELGLF
jgi:FeS assembly SUF system protein